MPRQRSKIISALLMSALFGMTPARADDAATCRTWTGEEALAACTRMITSDTLHGADLAQAYLWRGITHSRNTGDWDRAIADFSEAIRLGSRDAGAYAGRAGAYIRTGEIDRALPDLDQAIALDPKHSGVRNVFGYYYLKKGDYARGLAEVNEAIRLSPRYLYAFSTRGEIYEAKGELNNALADFRNALGLDPDKKQRGGRYAADSIARVEGKLFAAGGADWATCQRAPNLEDGIAACTRLISAKKLGEADLAQAYVWRGVGVGRYRGDVDLAIADYDEALRRDPKIVAAYAGRGGSYVRKGKLDLARRDLDEGLKLDPNHSGVHNALGNYYLAKGDHGSAIAEFNTAIRIAPQYLYPYRFRAEAYENRGDLAAALADYKIALSLDPGKQQIGGKEAAEGIARIEKKLAEAADRSKASADDTATCKSLTGEAALAACTRIISANASRTGELAEAHMWRGLAHLRGGDWDHTIADTSEAIRIGTKDSAAYCARAEAYVFKGDLDRARADLDRARALGPDRAILRNALGAYDLAKGDYAAAIAEFNTAARLFPQSLYAYRYRGEAYEKKGDLALALADYRVALGLDPTKQQIGGREAAEGIARVEQKLAAAADKSNSAAVAPKVAPVEAKASPAAPKVAALGHRVALVIGNSKYLYANPLPNPANDAADISRVLRAWPKKE